jgi:hypothetical protein
VTLPPFSGPLVAWVTAMQRGEADSSRAMRALSDDFQGMIWLTGDLLTPESALIQLAQGPCQLVLPIPGDHGWLPAEALTAGEALITVATDRTLVVTPPAKGERWWRCLSHPLAPTLQPTQLSFARRELSAAIRGAAEALENLGLQRGDPRLDSHLAAVNSTLQRHILPTHIGAVATGVIVQATTVLALTSLGTLTDGASVTALEASARLAPLREVSRAARAALVSAYSDPGTVDR